MNPTYESPEPAQLIAFAMIEAEQPAIVMAIQNGRETHLYVVFSNAQIMRVLHDTAHWTEAERMHNSILLFFQTGRTELMPSMSDRDPYHLTGISASILADVMNSYTQAYETKLFKYVQGVEGQYGIRASFFPSRKHTKQPPLAGVMLLQMQTKEHLVILHSKEQAYEKFMELIEFVPQPVQSSYTMAIKNSSLPEKSEQPVIKMVGPAAQLLGTALMFHNQ